jgi:hypothetical protein
MRLRALILPENLRKMTCRCAESMLTINQPLRWYFIVDCSRHCRHAPKAWHGIPFDAYLRGWIRWSTYAHYQVLSRATGTNQGRGPTLMSSRKTRTGPQDPSNNHATIHTVQRVPPAEALISTPHTCLPSLTSRCKKHTNYTVNMAASPNSEAITESIRRAARKQGTLGRPQLVVALAPETQDANATS